MQRTRKRLAAILPVLTVLAVIATAASRPFPVNKRAVDIQNGMLWANANKGHLPTSLEEVAALSPGYRKAVLINESVTLAQFEALWRGHLESFVKPVGELTPIQHQIRASLGVALTSVQVAFIRNTLDSLHAGLGAPEDTASRKAWAGALCASVKKLFDKSIAGRIFATVGPLPQDKPAIEQASLISDIATDIRGITVKLGLRKPPMFSCVCSINSICDCPGGTCVYDVPNCGQIPGCGCLSLAECDGAQCWASEK